MVHKSKVQLSLALPAYLVLSLVSFSIVFLIVVKVLEFDIRYNTNKYVVLQRAANGFLLTTTYIAVLLIFYLLYRINEITIQLAL